MDNIDRFVKFIIERERIRVRKEQLKLEKPWTKDPILQQFKFCNVRRQDDTVSRWIKEHWLNPARDEEHLWFAMTIARFVNWPGSLAEMKLPLPWNPRNFLDAMEDRAERGEKLFTGAYMIHAGPEPGKSKADYLVEQVFTPAWKARKFIAPVKGDTLASFAARLSTLRDFGSFMTGQVVADTKYGSVLAKASDWATWAISGPGSRRGLNRVLGKDVDSPWKEDVWFEWLSRVAGIVQRKCEHEKVYINEAQDVQNCLCEFDKYERVRLGQGRPRSTYPGR